VTRHPEPQDSIVLRLLYDIDQKLGRLLMGQSEIDADVQAIAQAVTSLGTAAQAIQAEIAALQAQGVDTSGLDAAVQQLGSAVQVVQQIVPAQPGTPSAG
jgi:hypothetical protein